MTIHFIAPGGAYKVQLTAEMPEYAEAVERMEAFFEAHPNAYLVNMTGRLDGAIGSYVVRL